MTLNWPKVLQVKASVIALYFILLHWVFSLRTSSGVKEEMFQQIHFSANWAKLCSSFTVYCIQFSAFYNMVLSLEHYYFLLLPWRKMQEKMHQWEHDILMHLKDHYELSETFINKNRNMRIAISSFIISLSVCLLFIYIFHSYQILCIQLIMPK